MPTVSGQILFRLLLLSALSPLVVPSVSHAEGTNLVEHRGFTFDDSAVTNRPNAAAIREQMKVQIDIILDVGLPAETLAAFRKVPLLILPQGSFKSPTPGRYLGDKKRIEMVDSFARSGPKPILLHEFMHFYHQMILTNGLRNADVLNYFQRARGMTAYDAKSHMMSNVGEFFATTTTTYLFGVTAQEPFKRSKIQENQPVYFDYLKMLLGPAAGKHEGSLTEPPKKEPASSP